MTRPSVLILMGAFWPGNDSSGPNQSVKALAEALRESFDFRLLARDAPFGARANAPTGWSDIGFAQARYLRVGRFAATGLREVLNETPHDLLWLNGFFDREFTLPSLALRRLGRIPAKPTLLSPRGEFGSGALALKGGRKQVFVRAARALGLLSGVALHATSEAEADAIRASVGANVAIALSANVRALPAMPAHIPGESAELRVAFVGRVSPVKRLHQALEILRGVQTPVAFSIFGPEQDAAYAAQCRALAAALPPYIRVLWRGEVGNDAILGELARTDLFFLPTAGENFGHAIFEALACGVPALISDQTPWRALRAAQAGWDLPLADNAAFAAAIQSLAAMTPEARAELRRGARAKAEAWVAANDSAGAATRMLRAALTRKA